MAFVGENPTRLKVRIWVQAQRQRLNSPQEKRYIIGRVENGTTARKASLELSLLSILPVLPESPFVIPSGRAYGRVIAGNLGSLNRLEYTVIGDAVNVAARLEKMTKQIGSPIAITQTVYNGLDECHRNVFGTHGQIELHGKSEVVPVYRLVVPTAVGIKSRIIRAPKPQFESVE